jgi:hypothetical protein
MAAAPPPPFFLLVPSAVLLPPRLFPRPARVLSWLVGAAGQRERAGQWRVGRDLLRRPMPPYAAPPPLGAGAGGAADRAHSDPGTGVGGLRQLRLHAERRRRRRQRHPGVTRHAARVGSAHISTVFDIRIQALS